MAARSGSYVASRLSGIGLQQPSDVTCPDSMMERIWNRYLIVTVWWPVGGVIPNRVSLDFFYLSDYISDLLSLSHEISVLKNKLCASFFFQFSHFM